MQAQITEMVADAKRAKNFLRVIKNFHHDILGAYSHQVFSYQSLPSLLAKLKNEASSSWFDEDDYTVRYLVTDTGEMWFARSGAPSKNTPSHADMTNSQCIAAGDILWSQDFTKIIRINNKSGHFKGHHSTLVWALGSLFAYGANFNSDLELEFHLNDASTESHIFTLEQLRSLIPTTLLDMCLQNKFVVKIFEKDTITFEVNEHNCYTQQEYDKFLATPLSKRKRCYVDFSLDDAIDSSKFGLFAQEIEPCNLLYPSTPPHTP